MDNLTKIAQLINGGFNLLTREIKMLSLELRNKKAPIINSQISISEDVSKGISQAVERSLDKLKIPIPQINIPEQKIPKIPTPVVNVEAPIVNLPPANITVEPTKVEFPKEMKVEGMDKLLESVNRETPAPAFDFSSKNPLAVMVVDSKGKRISEFGGDMTAPAIVGLKNTDREQIDPATEDTLAKIPGLSIPLHDEIVMTYTDDDLTTVVYKLATVTVATL